jgi:hypothetical protein
MAHVETEGLLHPGCRVNEGLNKDANRCKNISVGVRDSSNRIRCYACGDFGHVARTCSGTDGYGWKNVSVSAGNGQRVHGCSTGGSQK